MKHFAFTSALALTLACATSVSAQDTQPPALSIGDPAPALAIGEWVKGEPRHGL